MIVIGRFLNMKSESGLVGGGCLGFRCRETERYDEENANEEQLK
jgi:hypothetical protein